MRILLILALLASSCREEPKVVITVPVVKPKDVLANYTGRARELKEKSLRTGDPKDALEFIEWIKKHPEEHTGTR